MTDAWKLAVQDLLFDLREDLETGAEHGTDEFGRGYSMALQYCYDSILLKLQAFGLEPDKGET